MKSCFIKYLKDKGIKQLDGLILSHFDSDHAGGTIDILKENKTGIAFYLSNMIDLHRTKYDNADEKFNKFITQKEVSPLTKYIKSMSDLEKITFNVPSTKQNKLAIMISGLGWIDIMSEGQTIDVYVPKGTEVLLKEPLI